MTNDVVSDGGAADPIRNGQPDEVYTADEIAGLTLADAATVIRESVRIGQVAGSIQRAEGGRIGMVDAQRENGRDQAENDLPSLGKKGTEVVRVHPALDVVERVVDGETVREVYTTVRTTDEHNQEYHLLLCSDGDKVTWWDDRGQEERRDWRKGLAGRGVVPTIEALNLSFLTCQQWDREDIRAFLDERTAPDWADVYDAIRAEFDRHLVVPKDEYLDIFTAWSMATYWQPMFEWFPFLHPIGPAASGKTRAGACIANVAFNGIPNAATTRAAMLRISDQGRYCQVIGETDHLANTGQGDQLARDLHAGACRTEAGIMLTEPGGQGSGHTPRRFDAYSGRVLCSTVEFLSLPLRTRCIELPLVRSPQPDQTRLDRPLTPRTWAPHRDALYRLLLSDPWDLVGTQANVEAMWQGPGMPNGRTRDLWLPLGVIAYRSWQDCEGEDRPAARAWEIITRCAQVDHRRHQADALTSREALLWHFARWLVKHPTFFPQGISRDQVYGCWLNTGLGSPYPTWWREMGVAITQEQLGRNFSGPNKFLRALQDLSLLPEEPIHTKAGNLYRLDPQHITEVVDSYLGPMERDLGEGSEGMAA